MGSKRAARQKVCARKRAFLDERDAEVALRRLLEQCPREVMNVYRCGFCQRFHVGHTPRRKLEAIYGLAAALNTAA